MSSVEVIRGLVLDERMFETAAEGVAIHAADVGPLTWEKFVDPAEWWMIPDDYGNGYKAELTLRNDRERTIRLNNWFLPGLWGGDESRPHSHPWWFEARVIAGGYTEDRYERTGLWRPPAGA
jgi:hypothetical protein